MLLSSSTARYSAKFLLRNLFIVLPLACVGSLGLESHRCLAVDFTVEIEPILQRYCIDCHGDSQQESGFRVDRLAFLLKGGDSGEPAVVPSNPEESYLIKVITGRISDKRMPPDESLTEHEIERLSRWIELGASTPHSMGPAYEAPQISHWSFLPLNPPSERPSIDSLIEARLNQAGLTLSPRADLQTLFRRLHLIVHGLPPTPEQVERFRTDAGHDAWSRLVDHALASPRFGEAFAPLWLDLVRFGETNGFETNQERPFAWRFRDWIIQAFNQDKPYSVFVREQLAGDVLGEPLGTGFLVAGPYDIVKGQDRKLTLMQRMNELDDMLNATGTTFLGLTIGCARCHNHKFDPITQRDYYAMQAVFAGVHHSEGNVPLTEDTLKELQLIEERIAELEPMISNLGPSQLRLSVNARRNEEQFRSHAARRIRMTIHATNGGEPCIDEFQIFSGAENVALTGLGVTVTSSGDFVHPYHQLSHINDGVFGNKNSWIASKVSGAWVQFDFPEETLIDRIVWGRDREGKYTDRLPIEYDIESSNNPDVWENLGSSKTRSPFGAGNSWKLDPDNLPPDQADLARKWLSELAVFERDRDQLNSLSTAWIGRFTQPGPTYRLYRGEPEFPREQVDPDGPAAFVSLELGSDAEESRRRLAFADWLASDDNSLSARVIVNRLWQFHFGTGLVDTPNDFGQNGSPASHPELLDWLASELIQSGWSLKHIHRLILLSDTWQQDNRPRPEALSIDAENRLLWRFAPRRMSAEAIRDSILAASGNLNTQSLGGPGFSVFEIEKETVRHYHAKQDFGPEEWRRMLYMTRVRQEKDEAFGVFDCPDGSMGIAKRGESTTPLQALSLLNSPFVIQQAKLLAERLQRDAETTEEQIRAAWQLCYQRAPTPLEIEICHSSIAENGLVEFARALLNTNEFLFIP
jgi:hypothetical protein